jgi:hypothetical protein
MKISELLLKPLTEMATGGSSSAGSIASVTNPFGIVMRRPSLFGYVPNKPKKRKKSRKQ